MKNSKLETQDFDFSTINERELTLESAIFSIEKKIFFEKSEGEPRSSCQQPKARGAAPARSVRALPPLSRFSRAQSVEFT